MPSREPKSRHEYRDVVLSKHGPSTSAARAIAVALTMDMDSRSLESFASAERLAERTALSERTVRTALAVLRSEGWIEERNKERGRNFWLKYRRAMIPISAAGLAAESAGSHSVDSTGDPAEFAGTRLPASDAGLPANGARLPAENDTTPCKNLHGHPAVIADDPGSEITVKKDPEQDPGRDPGASSPSPANAGSDAQRGWSRAEVLERERQVDAQKRAELQEDAGAAVHRLLRDRMEPEQIASQLGVTLEFVLLKKGMRDKLVQRR